MSFPSHWIPVSFDAVFEQISTTGKKVKTADLLAEGEFPVIDQGRNFISGYLNDASLLITDEAPLIIFGDHTLEIKWIDFPFIPGADGVKILKPSSGMDGRFLYYFLCNLPIQSKGYARHFKILKDSQYLVPPVAEQTRIAQKLDELLAQVDTLKARIDAIPELLKRFRQSVLAAAVTGRLTEYWRQPEQKKQEWTSGFFTDFFDIQGGTQPPKSTFINTPREGYVQLVQIRDFGDKPVPTYVPESKSLKKFHKDDFLIGRYGASVGRICTGLSGAYNVALVKVEPLDSSIIYKPFLGVILRSPLFQSAITSFERSAQDGFNKADLSTIEINLPSAAEQTEIVRRVEQLFAFADQLEAKVATAKARIDRLTQSILAKAFRGELVPQDPNDEPASVLLERIQAQRAAAPRARRGRKATA